MLHLFLRNFGICTKNQNGNEIYREFEGSSTGSITISIGETLQLSVHFLDHDGNEIEHEEDGDDHEDEEGELAIWPTIDDKKEKPIIIIVIYFLIFKFTS